MKNGGKWVLGFACLTLLLCGVAHGQAGPADFNRLCLHNGGEYYISTYSDPLHGQTNAGAGKYYPSYTHIPSTPSAGVYEWKIRGWSWVGMKGPQGTPLWNWKGLVLANESNDYNYISVPSVNLSCTFPAPHAWASGALMTAGGGGWSRPVFQYWNLPSSIPIIATKSFLMPSTTSWSSGANIFSIMGSTFNTGTISPYYGYGFAVTYATSAIGIASSSSIYQYIFEDQGFVDRHYLIYSANEMDHNANDPADPNDGAGYKGKAQLIIWHPPFQVGWPLGITPGQNGGSTYALAMCLFVEDAILVPVNVMTDPTAASGPFSGFGFDVGTACMTPLVSDGNAFLGFATEDYKAPGQAYVVLASRHTPGSEYIGALQYDGNTHRYPCGGIDGVTQFFLARLSNWLHTVAYPYPACAYGNGTVGGHSAQLPIGTKFQANLPGKEYLFCGFPTNAVSNDCTAGWMVCWR